MLGIIFLIYFIELNKNFYIKNKDTQNNKFKSNDPKIGYNKWPKYKK